MPSRRLPTAQEAQRILAERRTRPAWRASPTAGKSLGKLLKSLEDRFGQGGPDVLRARWREIAGEHLGARTEPVKLVRNRTGGGATLEIRVEGPAAALIQHQAPQILARVNLFLGSGAVAKLRIVQGKVTPPAGALSPARARRLRNQPLDAAAEAKLQQGLSGAPDSPLRTSLLKLGREVMRRHADD
ncbi:MAG TPA: DciA family protein [Caulobacteraceae bacterium]|nr:DciA family protein [Caulobacteraceae bacterium]